MAVVAAAAAGAALTGLLPFVFPLEVVAAVVAGFVVVLVISLNPMAAVLFLALFRAALEGLQDVVIFSPGGIGISPTDVLSMAFVGGAALWLLRQARAGNQFWRNGIVFWAFLLLGVSTVTLVWSPDAVLGAKDLVKWSSAFAAFLILTAERPDPRRLRLLLVLIVVGAIPPLAVGLWQFVSSVGRVASHGGLRVQGTFTHPNFYGAYLVTISVAVLGLWPLVSARARKWLAVLGTATVLSLLLTLSRSSWIGFGLVILVVGTKHRKLIVGTAAGAAAVAVIAPRLLGRAVDAFQSAPDSGGVNPKGELKAGNSLLTRFNIWADEFSRWKQRPFLGHGSGYTYSSQDHGSHNDYMRMLVEGGIVGLGAFLGLMMSLVLTSVRWARGRTDLPLAFLGLTFAYVVESAGLNVFSKEAYQLYFWLLAGISYVWAQTVPPSGPSRAQLMGIAAA